MACAFLIYQGKHDAIAGSVPLDIAETVRTVLPMQISVTQFSRWGVEEQ